VDDLSRRNGALHRIEELDEFLMPVLLHTAPQHGAVEDVEGGKQRGGAVISSRLLDMNQCDRELL
jgi:hypothetical protein